MAKTVYGIYEYVGLYLGIMAAIGAFNLTHPPAGMLVASLVSYGVFYLVSWSWPVSVAVLVWIFNG